MRLATLHRDPRQQLAQLLTRRTRRNRLQPTHKRQDRRCNRQIVAQHWRHSRRTIPMRPQQHATHCSSHLRQRRGPTPRTRRKRKGTQDRLARLLNRILERLQGTPHWTFAPLDQVGRSTTPRRTQPDQTLSIRWLVRPSQIQQRHQCATKRGLSKHWLIRTRDLHARLAQLPCKTCPIGTAPRSNNRNTPARHASPQGPRHHRHDNLGLTPLALHLSRLDTATDRRWRTTIRIGLTKTTFQRGEFWCALKDSRRQLGDTTSTRQVRQSSNHRRQYRKHTAPRLVGQTRNDTCSLRKRHQQRLLRSTEIIKTLREQRLTRRPSCQVAPHRFDREQPQTTTIHHACLIHRRPPRCIQIRQRSISGCPHGNRIEQRRTKPIEARTQRIGRGG